MEGQQRFFRPPPGCPAGSQAKGERSGWGGVFAKLIRHGHQREQLPHYTRRQLELYFRQAERQEAADRAGRIVDIRAALSKEGDRLIKALRD
ncbi:hypothetical protein [endosymbiont of Tevnia jerichonana]|uniref:Uncharacterized protein n=1 Tax=endosymbiont of Riftia pachyptila (vent Ph05) TaxID=1048808 RepID=G2DGU6_9GAMM|nr:hypothetical protein [endosymbiont of Tevnia jerichonana]EGV50166.1 hypothetical protein Rifp1Sym_dx00110 [endosymbiont of Riftia pachyptila (vent Ph05)]